jgi:L-iditol 2-dehydrogenase
MKRLHINPSGVVEMRQEWERRPIQPGFVRVAVSACGVCGSDISIVKGKRKADAYFGHEFTGIITEVGPEVPDLKAGMRVASGLIKTCGRCRECLNGHPNYCHGLDDVLIPGGFCSETLVRHTDNYQFLTELPSTLDDITGTLNEPVSCALRIANCAEIKFGQSVLIIGLGAMGAITAELLRSFGAGMIVGMDMEDNRLNDMRDLGYEEMINRKDENWLKQIKAAAGREGVDVVIETTGSPRVLDDAFQAARIGARIVVGSVYHESCVDMDLLPIMRKELTVIGAKGPFPYRTSRGGNIAMDTLNTMQSRLKKFIRTYSYQEASRAFQDAGAGRGVKAVIVF